MKLQKFIYKTTFFLSPILFLLIITKLLYSHKYGGDLNRIGYVSDEKNYRTIFENEFKIPLVATDFVDIDLNTHYPNKYTVLNIGDSFSRQGKIGYQNYLAQNKDINVLSMNHHSYQYKSPVSLLSSLVAGDFFEKFEFKYVILQSVERYFINRKDHFKNNTPFIINNFKDFIKKQESKETPIKSEESFLDKKFLKYPAFHLLYKIKDNAYFSKVYQLQTTKPFFSTKQQNKILCYYEDIKRLKINNDQQNVITLNNNLNVLAKQLQQKGVQLIVLPAPDKFDLYFDYISNNEEYKKPLFFEYLSVLQKEYIYIDAKKILLKDIKTNQDTYFYGDTHWSPFGAKLIAKEIERKINLTLLDTY